MKKILVTGAGGYIGRHVVKMLLDKGSNVIATDIFIDGIDERAKIIQLDIFSGKENLYDEIGRPDACIHMAWKDGFKHNADSHIEFLSSHYTFIKNMINNGLSNITVMGTMHEIGYHEGKIDENTLCNPTSMYGIAKDSLRRAVMTMIKDKKVQLQWLRAFYIYGDDKKNNSIFAKIILATEEGKKTFPFTTGKNKYDFISVLELANQISSCVLQDKVTGIINCCTGNPISLAEKVEEFIRDNNLDIKLSYGQFPDREYDSPIIYGDNKKIKSIMNLLQED